MERAELSEALSRWRRGAPPEKVGGGRVVVAEADGAEFMRQFAHAVAAGGEVFVCDPHWGERERAQVRTILEETAPSAARPVAEQGWLMIPTGGSSGRLKFARHDQDTVAAAVSGFAAHFSVPRVDAIGVLPLYHVSGLVAWMRSVFTGGEYRHLAWSEVATGDVPELASGGRDWFVSLVPTQLHRLLELPRAVDWLKHFRAVLVGGGPSQAELLERAASAGLPLAPSYGMTETAAMVTALRPAEFRAGARDSGAPLAHAKLSLDAEGAVVVSAPSLFRGYYPAFREEGPFVTEDVGSLDARGHLTLLGRKDDLIITGGEKVLPAEVSAALHASGEFEAVAVLGVPDPRWGQVVVAAYANTRQPDFARVEAWLASRLAPFKRPKHYVAVDWPASELGKIKRQDIARQVAGRLRHESEAR